MEPSYENCRSIHCMGNGKLAVYEEGPDIIQIFGPPYSSPSYMSFSVCKSDNISIKSEREKETAIWIHKIYYNNERVGQILDFVDSELPCFIRINQFDRDIDFMLETGEKWKTVPNTSRYDSRNVDIGYVFTAEAGISVYEHVSYPCPRAIFHQVLIRGGIQVSEENDRKLIKFRRGKSVMFCAGGANYPECMENAKAVLDADINILLDRTREYWINYSNERRDFKRAIPDGFVYKDQLLSMIDSVSILLKTQQGVDGGVLAGHNYHLAYVRDQYGVARCFLELGYLKEARMILNFYWEIWKRHGVIHNAQAIGIDNIFHIHENDEVEITAYLIIQAFDYYEKSNDRSFITEIFPMLEWAWNVQLKHIEGDMLPFNGDETYIAGGILPRSAINDGSAEATFLFVAAGERLIRWLKENENAGDVSILSMIKSCEDIIRQVNSSFPGNFIVNGNILTNNTNRCNNKNIPRYRHGVCQSCGYFGWNERDYSDRYVCYKCFSPNNSYEEDDKKEYYIQSVKLMPLYIKSSAFDNEIMKEMILKLAEEYGHTGKLPSCKGGNLTVGYDYGILLYNLTKVGHRLAQDVFLKLISVIDSAGAWSEYYENDCPSGTRYRPWESGINLEAAINFALNWDLKVDL